MTRRTAAPFNRLDEAVLANPWMVTVGGNAPAPLQEITPDWDYAAPVSLERIVRVDHTKAIAELGLADTPFQLELLVEAGTGPGSLPREIVHQVRIALEPDHPCVVLIDLDPARLSAQVSLKTSILLAEADAPANPLAPRQAASRLWDDRIASRIEGDDPRFPMEVVSFSIVFPGRPHEEAPWTLSWSPGNPGRDFHGAVRLYLNADDEDFIQRVHAEDRLTLQALMGDVVSQMCETALRAGWDEGSESVEPASLAGRVVHWLERAFPDNAAARSLLEGRPGEFRAAILASMRL
jgi:hypothetical protein